MSEDVERAVFPFFVGCPRSGTTLVRAIFDAHPVLAVPAESHFIVSMADDAERYESPAGFRADAFLDDLCGDDRFKVWRFPEDRARRAVTERGPQSLPDAFRAVYAAYAAHHGKPLHGDKTPGYVRRLPLLAEMFPEARFVHVVRDGRDVALSLEQVGWARRQAPDGLATFAGFWRTNLELGFAAGQALGPRRYRELRYEELLDDPERVLRDVCDFLGLPFASSMLAYHEHAKELSAAGRPPCHIGRPVTKGLRDWRTEMDAGQVALFEGIAGDLLQRAGYALST